MTYFINDVVLDQALNYIKTNCTDMNLTEGAPSSAAGSALVGVTNDCANATMASGDFTLGDYAGAGLGRELAVAQKAGITVTTDSTVAADHVVLWNGVDTIYAHTQLQTSRSVSNTNGDTVTFNAWKIALNDAVVA